MSGLTALADLLDPPAWEPEGRPPLEPHQVPPEGDWFLWILFGGRGAGKTEGGARYFCRYMRDHPGHRGIVVGPTLGDVIEACVRGPSGLLAQDPDVRFTTPAGGAMVSWPNGSEAILVGTPTPRDVERMRAGGNRHVVWLEEFAANPQAEAVWDQVIYGVRLGDHPHAIATTTPRPRKIVRDLIESPRTVTTVGTIFDNPGVEEHVKAEMRERYEGTRIGRQELFGELLEDVPGALWTLDLIDRYRVSDPPDLRRVVVGVDPAVSSSEDADETGIVAAGVGVDGHVYVLEDRTLRASPERWARQAVELYHGTEADRIVGEVNNGGEMVELTLRTVDPRVSYRSVRATRGKALRAEPVAALYEQGRVHHVGSLTALEDQMASWTPGSPGSPDRLDALVWAVTELGFGRQAARVVKGPRM